jgi:hypothetical protein
LVPSTFDDVTLQTKSNRIGSTAAAFRFGACASTGAANKTGRERESGFHKLVLWLQTTTRKAEGIVKINAYFLKLRLKKQVQAYFPTLEQWERGSPLPPLLQERAAEDCRASSNLDKS